jgi:hypothetical protein
MSASQAIDMWRRICRAERRLERMQAEHKLLLMQFDDADIVEYMTATADEPESDEDENEALVRDIENVLLRRSVASRSVE